MKKQHIIGGIVAIVVAVTIAVVVFMKKANTGDTAPHEEEAPASVEGAAPVQEGQAPTDLKDSQGASVPAADSSENPKMKKIESFMQRSGVIKEFMAMDELLKAQFDQISDAAKLSPEDQAEVDQVKKLISSEAMTEKYKEYMNESFNDQELDRLNAIYDDPLISNYTQARLDNQTPDGQKKLMEHYKDFKVDSLSPERRKQLEAIDKNNGSTENTMKMITTMNSATSRGMKADPKREKAQKDLENSLRPTVQKANMAVNDMNTANLNGGDLNAQIKLMSDPVYHKEVEVKQKTLSTTVEQLGTLVSEKTQKMVQEHKDSRK